MCKAAVEGATRTGSRTNGWRGLRERVTVACGAVVEVRTNRPRRIRARRELCGAFRSDSLTLSPSLRLFLCPAPSLVPALAPVVFSEDPLRPNRALSTPVYDPTKPSPNEALRHARREVRAVPSTPSARTAVVESAVATAAWAVAPLAHRGPDGASFSSLLRSVSTPRSFSRARASATRLATRPATRPPRSSVSAAKMPVTTTSRGSRAMSANERLAVEEPEARSWLRGRRVT